MLALSVPTVLGVSAGLLLSVPSSLDVWAPTLKELRPECRNSSSKKKNDSSTAIEVARDKKILQGCYGEGHNFCGH